MGLIRNIQIIGLTEIPEIQENDHIAQEIIESLREQNVKLSSGDILVVTHKIVSKSEGRVVFLKEVTPGLFASNIAKTLNKDPVVVEVILQEAVRIVKMSKSILITETKHGFVCVNSGVDLSNIHEGYCCLLPQDPDLSARTIKNDLEKYTGCEVGVVITDTVGRPWRLGQVNIAIGVAGLNPLVDYRGKKDNYGNELKVTNIAIVDEIAAAAELVMGKIDRVPAAIVRGLDYAKNEDRISNILRRPEEDIFR